MNKEREGGLRSPEELPLTDLTKEIPHKMNEALQEVISLATNLEGLVSSKQKEVSIPEESYLQRLKERNEQKEKVEKIEEVAKLLEMVLPENFEKVKNEDSFLKRWVEEGKKLAALDQEIESMKAVSASQRTLETFSRLLAFQKEGLITFAHQWILGPEEIARLGREAPKEELIKEIRESIVEILQKEARPFAQKLLVKALVEKGFSLREVSRTLSQLTAKEDEEIIFGWCSPSDRFQPGEGKTGAMLWLFKSTPLPEGAAFFPGLKKWDFGDLVREKVWAILEEAGQPLSVKQIYERILASEQFRNYRGGGPAGFAVTFIKYGLVSEGKVKEEKRKGTTYYSLNK